MSDELRILLELQHLDYMIKDWRNDETRKEFQKIGFQVDDDPVKMLCKKREKLLERINPNLYNMYQRILDRYKDWAVVPVVNGFCGGCFSKVPTELSAQKGIVNQCPNCGRFIYWD
jgi:predicted  nucleic acid-binding Zn-ribbon protein